MVLSAVFFLFLALFADASSLLAEKEISYDPYISILKYPEANQPKTAEKRNRNQFLARILEQPLRPIEYGVGKTAQWVEEKHMDQKTIWLVDELSLHGIHPSLKFPTDGSFGTFGPEAMVELDKLFKIQQPYVSADVFGGWTPNKDFAGSSVELGGHYEVQLPLGHMYHEGNVHYSRSSAERFYGIGQDSSPGNLSTYQPEELALESKLGFPLGQTVESTASFIFQRMNIGNGNRERVGKIKEHFPIAGIPGINGGDLIGLVAGLGHDNRDRESDPKHGGYESLGFSYFHGVDGKDFHYLKVSGEVSHYFPIASDRRIFAVRLVAEKNQELGGGQIPFYNLSRLGGSGRSDGSGLLRSYNYNRFFEEGLALANFEYRYNIYEYGDFAADVVALFDAGEVFEEIGRFGFDELRLSYGGGLNIKFRRRTLLSVTIAHGDEGWQTGAQTKVSF